MLGLFQLHLEQHIAEHVANGNVREVVAPIQYTLSSANFLLTSIYVIYFALYKADSIKINCLMLILRVLTLVCYVPLLLYFGAYLDAIIIWLVLAGRIAYTSYWAVKYKNIAFIFLNTDNLAFICGKYWYYEDKPYIVLPGGEHFVTFGPHFVTFVVAADVYVALRGKIEMDVPLTRCVELLNGAFIYVFTKEACVGIFNICSSEFQLCEETNLTDDDV